MSGRTLLLTFITLVAFASNSVLARLALYDGAIDAASFTAVRLLSGALMLSLVILLPQRSKSAAAVRANKLTFGSWTMGLVLSVYAIAFSFAYLSLSAATGGLILFGCVQATMILYGIAKGEHPSTWEWIGLAVALAGLVYLFLPKLEAPSLVGGTLMALSGVGWGLYSVLGREVPDPALATAGNFVRVAPFAAVVGLAGLSWAHASTHGVLLAVTSGAVTSGLGYIVWYHALQGLTATRAAVVQLAVPIFVAVGGVLFIGESMTLTLAISGLLILGGIGIVVFGKSHKRS